MRALTVLRCLVAAAPLLLPAAATAAEPAPTPYTEAQRLAAVHCEGVPGSPRATVLLIPGTGVDAEQNWSWGYARALRDAGHGICTVDPPERSQVDVQDSVLFVRTAIEEAARRDGRRIDVIGHSQGAFHAVHVLRLFPELAPLVDDVVGLAGLYERGSDAIRADCAQACSPPFWQVATGSRYMAALARRPLPAGPSYTAIGTLYDTVVTPQPAVNALAGGRSIELQDVCPGRRFVQGEDHIYLAADAVGYALAVDALDHPGPADPARVPATACLQQVLPGADLVKLATLGPSLLAAATAGGPSVPAEPPLRCPLADGCAAPVAAPTAVRVLSWRARRGAHLVLRVRTDAAGRLRLRFVSPTAVTPSVRLRPGTQTARVPLRTRPRLRPGLRRAVVEVRRSGAAAWTVVRPLHVRVLR